MVPVLRTSRLELSPFNLEDAPAVFQYASNPKVAEHVTWNAHRSEQDSREFIRFITEKARAEPGNIFFSWAIRKNAKAIGSISFSQPLSHIGQIDYALGAEHWSQGFVTEAARTVIDWSLGALPRLIRIQAKCLPENKGSRRVMEKVGMSFEGISRAAFIVKGKPVDLAIYALVRN